MQVNPQFVELLTKIEGFTPYAKYDLMVALYREQLSGIRFTFEYEKAAESNRLISVRPTIHIDYVKGVEAEKAGTQS